MFCPKCATQNVDGASFCRVCGANISLVPQALTGQLPAAEGDSRAARRARRRHAREPTLDHALKNIFMGVAFLFVSFALARSFAGAGWWFWMLIPAFSLLGKGVANIVTTLHAQRAFPPTYTAIPPQMNTAGLPPQANYETLTPQPNYETVPPPSVTETTTRHLDAKKDSYSERS